MGTPPRYSGAMSGYEKKRMSATVTPAAFIGHGNPMNALESNHYTQAWTGFGAALCVHPQSVPRAILVISAHWYQNFTALTAMAAPRTIHDFFGFPPELSAVQYPAPGAPDIAVEIAETVRPTWVGLDHDSWGLDHGTWSVLCHAFPSANVPVLQLSINAQEPLAYHFELGTRLAELRRRGVVIVGSGNVVHNLARIDWSQPDAGYDWARRFDEAACTQMTESPDAIGKLLEHSDFGAAVPTPDHFLPLVYVAGLAAAEGHGARVLVDGFALGSISMAAYTLDAEPLHPSAQDATPSPPLPHEVPPEDTNI